MCKGGSRECDILKWQAFVYIHWLELPEIGLPYYACLQATAVRMKAVTKKRRG